MKRYDVVIAGSGPAGMSCAIALAMKGINCLIIEKRASLNGKVCGDGLTPRAVNDLKKLNINVLELNGKKINSKCTVYTDRMIEEQYGDLYDYGIEYAYGVSRDILDNALLNKAIEVGVDIVWNLGVNKIKKIENEYIINDLYRGMEVVLACGALGISGVGLCMPTTKMPMGISARIKGKCSYKDDRFYFFQDKILSNGYAWLFPVGNELWNLGVWSNDIKKLKDLYYEYEGAIFDADINYCRPPKGAIIGASKEGAMLNTALKCIGDCALKANFYTGEGVSFAIEDGIKCANEILAKTNEL